MVLSPLSPFFLLLLFAYAQRSTHNAGTLRDHGGSHQAIVSLHFYSLAMRRKAMATGELACTYAALILFDDGIPITVRF